MKKIDKTNPQYKRLLKEHKIYIETSDKVSIFSEEPKVMNKIGITCFSLAGILTIFLIIIMVK